MFTGIYKKESELASGNVFQPIFFMKSQIQCFSVIWKWKVYISRFWIFSCFRCFWIEFQAELCKLFKSDISIIEFTNWNEIISQLTDMMKSTLGMHKDYVANSPINMIDSRVYSRKNNYKGLLDSDECHTNQMNVTNNEHHKHNHYMENA